MNHAGEINEDWRDQVASRVNNYRERRGRKLEGEFSMRFDFDSMPDRYQPIMPLETGAVPDIAMEPESANLDRDLSFLDAIEPLIAPPAVDPPAPDWSALAAQVEEINTNIIEFPRTATLMPPAPPSDYEIAEPVFDKPRILDVPEQVAPVYPTVTGPLFADLSFHDLEPQEVPEEVFGPPVPIATIRQRVVAGCADAGMVTIGVAAFLLMALHFMVPPPPPRGLLMVMGSAFLTAWIAYEYLFLVHGTETLGMKLLGLRLVNFSGEPALKYQRRFRAVALPLSAVSLLAGFLWAFADEDSLCWHDRISQTYLSKL